MSLNFIGNAALLVGLLAFLIYCHKIILPALKEQTALLEKERVALQKELDESTHAIHRSILFNSQHTLGEEAEDRYLAYISTVKSMDADQWLKDREIKAATFMLKLNRKLTDKLK